MKDVLELLTPPPPPHDGCCITVLVLGSAGGIELKDLMHARQTPYQENYIPSPESETVV